MPSDFKELDVRKRHLKKDEGLISDNQIVVRSGFLELLNKNLQTGEIKEGDSVMADKGFEIQDHLSKLHLKLNTPPFLKNKVGFEEADVLKTQTISSHRIHFKGPLAKLKGFDFFILSSLFLFLVISVKYGQFVAYYQTCKIQLCNRFCFL